MAAVVESVPNAAFAVAPLTTTSGTIVSRRKMKIPCNYPTDYGHNRQSTLPFYVDFDIQDAECFLDLKSLRFCFTFRPDFTYDGANKYRLGQGPVLDGSIQSLIASVHIMNTQGTEFETILNYGHIACAINKYNQNAVHRSNAFHEWSDAYYGTTNEETFHAGTSTAVPRSQLLAHDVTANEEMEIVLTLQQSMFLNRIRMLPLFLFRSALRVRIEFQDPRLAFKVPLFPTLGNLVHTTFPSGGGVLKAITTGGILGVPAYLFRERTSRTGNGTVSGGGTVFTTTANTNRLVPSAFVLGGQQVAKVNAVTTFDAANGAYAYNLTGNTSGSGTIANGAATLDSYTQLPNNTKGLVRFTFANGDTQIWIYQHLMGVTEIGAPILCLPLNAVSSTTQVNPDTNEQKEFNVATTGDIIKCEWTSLPLGWTFTDFALTANAAPTVLTRAVPTWNYRVNNCEVLCDYIKPSSEVMVQYLNAFNTPSGIPYAYSSLLYHQQNIPDGNIKAPLQISLPFSVRSLKGIMVMITDPLSVYAGTDSTVYHYPSMSSLQMRGLREAELTIGGQRFPGYKYQFYRNVDQRKRLVQEHFQELENLFNITGNALVTPNFHPSELYRYGTDYRVFGNYDGLAVNSPVDFNTNTSYKDTSSFVLCFTTQKTDGDFASGIDTTAAGSITLNLFLDAHCTARPRLIHVYGFADRVATLQKDATLVRA
jgi:hypothetical protein